MKSIKIFLASSAELKQERKEFREFLSVENDRIGKKGTYLDIVQWEYAFSGLTTNGSQTIYNEEVRQSDIFVCLLYSKVGTFTQQEFDTALEQFLQTGRPIIYTYFKGDTVKHAANKIEDQSLMSFKKKLDDLKHFYTYYHNIDDLKYKFRIQLDLLDDKGVFLIDKEHKKQTEENFHRYLPVNKGTIRKKIIVYLAIIFLIVISSFSFYLYKKLQEPFNLKIRVKNQNFNPELPEPVGTVSLTYGTKTEIKDNVKVETTFESIPSNFRFEKLNLHYYAEGFVIIDTTFIFSKPLIIIEVHRNDDLASISGFISSPGRPLPGVRVSTDCCKAFTDSAGQFKLLIPIAQQRLKQRLTIYKKGYKSKDLVTPVFPGEAVRLILQRE